MLLNCEIVNITKNSDGTYKVELVDCRVEGKTETTANATIIFHKVTKEGVDLLKNTNKLPSSEILPIDTKE